MKKVVVAVAAFVAMCGVGKAQNGAFKKGDNLVNVGIGLNSGYSGGIPFGGSYEKGINDDVSVGVNFDYFSKSYDLGFGVSDKFTVLYLGARGAYHFNKVLKIETDKADLYGGATAGYRVFSWSDGSASLGGSYGSGLFVGAFIGGKYYFTDKIGVFSELGAIGSTNVRVGVGFKF